MGRFLHYQIFKWEMCFVLRELIGHGNSVILRPHRYYSVYGRHLAMVQEQYNTATLTPLYHAFQFPFSPLHVIYSVRTKCLIFASASAFTPGLKSMVHSLIPTLVPMKFGMPLSNSLSRTLVANSRQKYCLTQFIVTSQ